MVIMYADTVTESMHRAIDETNRRREIQHRYNVENRITPASVSKEIHDIIEREYHTDDSLMSYVAEYRNKYRTNNLGSLKELLESIRADMLAAADALEFEKAAVLRDQMLEMEKKISLLEKAK
jgi:excinuclease ABC subunit B